MRPDRHTRGLDALATGEAVTLVDERGRGLASALVDPEARICARVYADSPETPFDPTAALERAVARRRPVADDPAGTDVYRLVHGEADGLPGLRIERYADLVVIICTAACALPALPTVCAGLRVLQPGARLVIREHLDDLRRRQVRTRLADGSQPDPATLVRVRELGVPLLARPCADLATGIYVDQRGTRRWLRARCRERRVLNLFAYTGVFSVSLLEAGASAACDVDLAGPPLALATRMAAEAGVGECHRTHKQDCRVFLAESDAMWDLIVCDPPTAARGKRGWVQRRDYPDLLTACAAHLAPGGLLVASSNTLGGKPFPLREQLARTGLELLSEHDGPALEPDIPQRRGFPEGRPFRLVVGQAPAAPG